MTGNTGNSFDLDAYLARIGYDGPRTPTLETLRGIHYAQAMRIPFENLSIMAGEPVELGLEVLQAKLVTGGRGGYCFELNALLQAALEALGFAVTPLIGRVRWQQPEEAAAPRAHMLLKVDLDDGSYLADAGFGILTMTAPLAFEADAPQQTPHEPWRLVEHGGGYELQVELGGKWERIYRFTMEPQDAIDFEVANWYISSHPQSIFVQFLIAARPFADRRITVFNSDVTIRYLDGRVEQLHLETADDFTRLFADEFGIALSQAAVEGIAQRLETWRAMAA